MTLQVYTGFTSYVNIAPSLISGDGYLHSENSTMISTATVGKSIRRRRRELEISQADLAKRLKTSQRRISEIELNKVSLPLHTFLALAAELEIDPVVLMRGGEK